MSVRHTRRKAGEFAIHTIANDSISLSIAPELGGRIVSMRDRISHREWMDGWSPVRKRRIWHPTDPANFETGPGAGLDECLPTVLPCRVDRRSLPDHGELWNQPPDFDIDPSGRISCRWVLKSLPLDFQRVISIRKNEICFDYQIENRAESPTPFLWAWHALFTWKPGDQIQTREKTCLSPGGTETLPWPANQAGNDLSRAAFPKSAVPAAKVFLGPLSRGNTGIRSKNGATLTLDWPAALFPYAGIWITRGFWKGLHHWAIEPSNAPVDRLSDILNPDPLSVLGPREIRQWTLTARLSQKIMPGN
jgi:hypothetical protein